MSQNPFEFIRNDMYYGTTVTSALDDATTLALRVAADAYTPGTMPAGSNQYKWVLAQWDRYRPNVLITKLSKDWNSRANRV